MPKTASSKEKNKNRKKVDELGDKLQQSTDKLEKTIKQAKAKFEKTDPKKQQMIIAGISAAVASIATVIGIKSGSKTKSKK